MQTQLEAINAHLIRTIPTILQEGIWLQDVLGFGVAAEEYFFNSSGNSYLYQVSVCQHIYDSARLTWSTDSPARFV